MEVALTRLLNAAAAGDKEAEAESIRFLMPDLESLARRELGRWSPYQTLQACDLVDELYLRLFGREGRSWPSRRYFFRAAAKAMHEIMIERFRRWKPACEPLASDLEFSGRAPIDLVDHIALKDALAKLDEHDARAGEAMRLQCVLQLGIQEMAEILEVGTATIERDLRYARTWLHRQLHGAPPRSTNA